MNILITGSGSGIGAGMAHELAKAGHRLLVTDLNGDSADAVATDIRSAGGLADALTLDVTSDASVAALVKALPCTVDALVNNAGLQHVARLEDFPMETWTLLVDVMLTGPARLTRALLPGMRERNFGRIVNTGSVHSLVASPFKSAYVSAKHGLLGFSKVIALEVADRDITINTVCPAYVRTPLVDKQITAQAREHGMSPERVVDEIMLKPMPKRAFIGIDEIAGIIEFLISPPARNITGQTIVVDGGWTAR